MIEEVAKSGEEQAVGAFIESIVTTRLENLQQALANQDLNLRQALELIEECKHGIYEDIIETNRGGEDGKAGFIAEWLEVYLGNARRAVIGKLPDMVLNNDNKAADYHIADVAYQSKFVLAHYSLDAVREHAEKYPDFVADGGRYTVPADFFERIKEIGKTPGDQVGELSRTEQTIWLKVQQLKEEGIEIDKNLGPSGFNYLDARANHADGTLARETAQIKTTDQEIRAQIRAEHAPSVDEMVHSITLGAALEAGMGLALPIYDKIKSGKRLSEFTGLRMCSMHFCGLFPVWRM